ncbi:hypothetical protein AAG906_007023 [Vitis piasezkii]
MSTPSSSGLPFPNISSKSSSLWVLDSGASHHMSLSSSSFVSMCHSPSSVSVITADSTPMPLAGVGSICTPYLSLFNVYCIPKLTMNLIFNEVAKRKHRHIVGTARSLLLSAGVPSAFWGKVVLILQNFAYSCYSLSFTSFLASLHNLCEPTSYTEILGICATSASVRALLVLVGFIKSKQSHMVQLSTTKLVASARQWHISQMEVKNIFLNGDLKKEVYMVPSPSISHNPREVCRLKKAFSFVKSISVGHILLSLYVDDMIITSDDVDDTWTVDTPLELNVRYASTNGTHLPDSTLYRTLVGSLIYLTITRPDISYVVHIVNQFVAFPTTIHWVVVLRILCYLWGTLCQSLVFPSTSFLELCAYCDAD